MKINEANDGTRKKKTRARLKLCLLASVLIPVMSPYISTAHAQSAEATGRYSFDIGPQPLSQALLSFSTQTGIQLFFNANLARGIDSRGAHGSLKPDAALAQILAGSGLHYRFTNANTVTISGSDAASDRDAASSDATSLAPIVVNGAKPLDDVRGFVAGSSLSATKTGTPLIETPQTVSVITKDQIDAQKAETVRQALRYAPGVYTSDDADNRLDYFNARGFALDQYLDGLKLNSGTWSAPKFEPYLLDRVEVLQGPSSVLYGQASPGGLVNLVSKRPTDDAFNEVQIQAGDHNRIQTGFDFNGPINDDNTVLYRLTGVVRRVDPQVDYTKEERLAIAPSFTWQPDADTSLTFLGGYLRDPASGIWNQLPYEGTLLPNPNGKFSRSFYVGDRGFENFGRTQYNIGYEFDHNFNEVLSFHQDVRFLHQSLNYNAVQAGLLEADLRTLDRSAYVADETLNTFSVDNRVQANFDTGTVEHTAIVGLDYQRKNWDNFTRWQWGGAPTLDILNPDYNQTIAMPPVFQDEYQSLDQLGVYAQDQMKIGNFSFLLGGRQDWTRLKTNDHLADTSVGEDNHAFTWRTGAVYQFDNGIAPYVSYSTSFQPTSGTDAAGKAFTPTTGDQYEIGVKYQPTGSNSFYTVSAFDLRQQNVLTADLDPTHPSGSQIQAGEVRTRGIDLSAVMSLTDGLSMRASYTHLDPEITRSNDGVQGNRPNNVPQNIASLWGDYTFQSGALQGFGLGGGIKYVGSSPATDENLLSIPSHVVVDAALHYDFSARNPKLKGLRLDVNAYNLFDRKFIDSCSLFGCAYGNGRTVYGTLTYRF